MRDVIQQAMEALASQNVVTRDIAIACAVAGVYVLCAVWALIAVRERARFTVTIVVRIGLMVVLAYLASKVLTHLVPDPRPYIVTHTRPLTTVSRDNGFPSDHTLLAAALTASFWWIDRRFIAAFAVGTLIVGLARLGIGAHHTLDIAGSMAIVLVAALLVRSIPLPRSWDRSLLPARYVARPKIGSRQSVLHK